MRDIEQLEMPQTSQVEPAKVPVATGASAKGADAKDERERKTLFGLPLPESISDAIYDLEDKGRVWRRATITALPAFLVNYSSNILGAFHVWTEGIMFKASLKGSKLVDKASNPIDYVIKAGSRIYKEAFEGILKKTNPEARVDIFDGNPVKNVWNFVTDTKAATNREILAQHVHPTKVQLGNPWQTRSTFSGLTGWTMAMLVPEGKESDDELMRMEIMRRTNPVGYAATRVGQAFNPLQWTTHKREMTGVWQMAAGVFSMLGAWRNRTKPNAAEMALGKLPEYVFNKAYFGTGVCSLFAGSALTFAPDDSAAAVGYGNSVTAMSVFLPFSLGDKFKNKEPGVWWYTGGKVSFQLKAWMQELFGGAEKKPDGTIVDHDEIRREAAKRAHLIKAERKHKKEQAKHPEGNPFADSFNETMAEAKQPTTPEPQTPGKPGTAVTQFISNDRVAQAPALAMDTNG